MRSCLKTKNMGVSMDVLNVVLNLITLILVVYCLYRISTFRLITVCQSKIHRAKVTHADVHYDSTPGGNSITIPPELVDAGHFTEGRLVFVNNLRNGFHWKTYIIKGEPGSSDICLNGPPAALSHFKPDDLVIILGYMLIEPRKVKKGVHPTTVYVDAENKIVSVKKGNI